MKFAKFSCHKISLLYGNNRQNMDVDSHSFCDSHPDLQDHNLWVAGSRLMTWTPVVIALLATCTIVTVIDITGPINSKAGRGQSDEIPKNVTKARPGPSASSPLQNPKQSGIRKPAGVGVGAGSAGGGGGSGIRKLKPPSSPLSRTTAAVHYEDKVEIVEMDPVQRPHISQLKTSQSTTGTNGSPQFSKAKTLVSNFKCHYFFDGWQFGR